MKRIVLALLLLATSCGGDVAPSTPSATPGADLAAAAVADWLAAIGEGRIVDAVALTHERSSIIVISAENLLDASAVEGLAAGGVPLDIAVEYWTSFASEFTTFSATPIGELEVGTADVFVLDGRTFAAVALSAPTGIDETEILVTLEDGTWLVDPTATFGPSLTRLIEVINEAATADGQARALLTNIGRSSLRAGLGRAPGTNLQSGFRSDLEALIDSLE